MDFLQLRHEGQGRVGNEEILQVVVDMRRLVARRLAGHIMAVDHERQVPSHVPGMQGKAGDAGFLLGFAERRKVEGIRRFVMAARLQPAADGDVVDEQRLAMIG